jgi:membrane protein YdbS with pleckstrin-like domain
MKCQQCGAEVAQGAAFCQACGKPLTGAAAFKTAATPRPAQGVASDADDKETVLWEGRYSKLAMIDVWIYAGALTVAVMIAGYFFQFSREAWVYSMSAVAAVWIALLLRLIYMQFSIRYTLTNQRLLHERGLLWRQTDRIEAIDIDDVQVNQGPIERMLGIGNVRVISSDQSTPQFSLVGIEDVRNVATLIDEVRRKERRKRAVHIESV